MPNPRTKWAAPVAIVVVILPILLFGGYMGAYFAMLEGERVGDGWVVEPVYRAGDPRAARLLMGPAHQIDRRIRRDHWELDLVQ